MIFQYDDYRNFLREIFKRKQLKNPQYSLRAFAQTLDVPVSTLSDVLRDKKVLTLESAEKITPGLRLQPSEARYFRMLVELQLVSPESIRYQQLKNEVESVSAQASRTQLDKDQIESLTQCWLFTLIELAGIDGFQLNEASAAAALSLQQDHARQLLKSLVEAGQLELLANGSYQKKGTGVMASSETVNLNLRQFHMEMMDRAKRSLIEQKPQERFVGSETFSFDSSQLSEANEIIEEFFSKMIILANRTKQKDSVYHVGVQMFRLAKVGPAV
ncbi:TIGR02147 family protein [Bdellovibrio sp. HCB2-146]|uniref:TIGR02147 family protein n=1 Tax=Bdellovibrio sp. HCB2-146 TaxID=3394362 RepID=UPI0039BC461E